MGAEGIFTFWRSPIFKPNCRKLQHVLKFGVQAPLQPEPTILYFRGKMSLNQFLVVKRKIQSMTEAFSEIRFNQNHPWYYPSWFQCLKNRSFSAARLPINYTWREQSGFFHCNFPRMLPCEFCFNLLLKTTQQQWDDRIFDSPFSLELTNRVGVREQSQVVKAKVTHGTKSPHFVGLGRT